MTNARDFLPTATAIAAAAARVVGSPDGTGMRRSSRRIAPLSLSQHRGFTQ